MPMRYAHEPDVLHDLQIEPDDTDTIDRVVRLENALADAFDAKVGRRFDTGPLTEMRVLVGRQSDLLILHSGVRSISTIMQGTQPVDAEDWQYAFTTVEGISYGVQRTTGEWVGAVEVTAQWADGPAASVPKDVRHALTLLTVKEYRRLTSSPTEQVGPDGMIVSTPSGWNDPTVKAAIEAHTLTRILV